MGTSPSSTNAGTTNASGPIASDHSHAASTEHSVDTTIVGVADEIWSELVVALLVENPSSISSYYNDMIKNDDKSVVNKLDHVVIQTNDADGFIDIYRDIYNIRLALDKYVEAWKSRMLFFRCNKATIEVIEKKDEQGAADKLWGLSWQVDSIEEARNRLLNQGVEVTPIKKGIKENTLVATIKSHTNNVPTLLIQHL